MVMGAVDQNKIGSMFRSADGTTSTAYPSGNKPISGGLSIWTYTTPYNFANPGIIQFATSYSVVANTLTLRIYLERVAGSNGEVSALVSTLSTSGAMAMTDSSHFTNVSQTITFADQQVGVKAVDIPIHTSPGVGLHYMVVTLSNPTNGVLLRNAEHIVWWNDGNPNPNSIFVTTSENLQVRLDSAVAGDLILLRGNAGVHTYTGFNGGDWAGPKMRQTASQTSKIVIAGYPGENAEIDQQYTAEASASFNVVAGLILSTSHQIVRDLKISKTLNSGVVYGGANLQGLRVENCLLENMGNPPNGLSDYINESDADNIGAVLLDGSFGAVIANNIARDIYDLRTTAGGSNPWNSYPANGHSGFHGFYMEQAWFHNNFIQRARKGIFQKNPDDTDGIGHRINNNYFSQITEACVTCQFAGAGQPGANYVHVYKNVMDCSDAGSSNCWGVWNEMPSSEQTSDAHSQWVYNNTKIGGRELLIGRAVKKQSVFNNVLYNVTGFVRLEEDGAVSNIEISDNNCFSGGSFQVQTQQYTANAATFSSLANWQIVDVQNNSAIMNAPDANSITSTPTFVNAGADDYRTTTGPTVGAGLWGSNTDIGIGSEVAGNI